MGNAAIWLITTALAVVLALLLVAFRALKSKPLIDRLLQDRLGSAKDDTASVDVAAPYQLVRARYGWMLVNSNDAYLGQAIIQYGECCELEVKLLLQLIAIRPGVVIEIGTNIGTHTVPMALALAGQNRQMTVFEPQPFIFQNMCANLALNGLANVTAWPYACGDRPGTLFFPRTDYHAQGNFGGISMTEASADAAVAVPCHRLDDLVDATTVSMMKIDVEGFELRALQGAADILTRSRPVLYVENDRIEQSKELIEWLWSKDYRLWWHIPPLFNPDNFFKNENDVYKGVCSFNMIGLPRELDFPLKGFDEITSSAHPLSLRND